MADAAIAAKPNWCDVRAVSSLLWPWTSGGNPLPSASKSYVAHGFQTLARRHRLAAADHVISEKDASWPLIAEVSCLSRSDECPPPQHLACQGIALWEWLIRTFRVDRPPFVDQQAHVDRRQDSACGRQRRQRLLVVSPAQNLVAQAVSCRWMAPRSYPCNRLRSPGYSSMRDSGTPESRSASGSSVADNALSARGCGRW